MLLFFLCGQYQTQLWTGWGSIVICRSTLLLPNMQAISVSINWFIYYMQCNVWVDKTEKEIEEKNEGS